MPIIRITQPAAAINYTNALAKALYQENKTAESIYSGRTFNKYSENPSDGIRAQRARTELSDNTAFTNNCENVMDTLEFAEESLRYVSGLFATSKAKILQAITDTNSYTERKIIAEELKSIQANVLKSLNADTNGKYVFGGSNLSEIPFTVDAATDKLQYHGNSEALNVDLGLGMSYTPAANGTLEQTSVFDASISGIEVLGDNTDNFYNNLTDIVKVLEDPAGDMNDVRASLAKLENNHTNTLLAITKLGSNFQFVENNKLRLESNEINISERQSNVEFTDYAEASTQYATDKLVYNAALSIGQQIIQPSLLDYLK